MGWNKVRGGVSGRWWGGRNPTRGDVAEAGEPLLLLQPLLSRKARFAGVWWLQVEIRASPPREASRNLSQSAGSKGGAGGAKSTSPFEQPSGGVAPFGRRKGRRRRLILPRHW